MKAAKRGRRSMTTVKVNLAEICGTVRYDETAPEIRPPAGWSVFLCDEQGNILVHPVGKSGPVPEGNGYLEVRDVPPGRRLLFARW
jgi:hypothetical protein